MIAIDPPEQDEEAHLDSIRDFLTLRWKAENLIQVENSEGSNLLHVACFKNNFKVVRLLCDWVYEQEGPELTKEWVNKPTKCLTDASS